MSPHKRLSLTLGAKKLLNEYCQKVKDKIRNIAERKALDEDRGEVNETDVIQALGSIAVKTHNIGRKWGIRILFSLCFTFLTAQVGAIYQLLRFIDWEKLPLVIQTWLIFPGVIVLCLMIFITWVLREDWT